jgi:predicted nucleotidyltransferase
MNIKSVNFFEDFIKSKLPKTKCIFMGSATLALLGIRENNDLDILVNDEVFNRLYENKKYIEDVGEKSGEKSFYHADLQLSIYREVYPNDLSFSDIKSRAIKVDGYQFMSLDDVIYFKVKMMRPKDRRDLKLITRYKNEAIQT